MNKELREDYIKSLEGFMIKVAKIAKCLPDFTDPENENNHILRSIDPLSIPKQETIEQWEKRTGEAYPDEKDVWSWEDKIEAWTIIPYQIYKEIIEDIDGSPYVFHHGKPEESC